MRQHFGVTSGAQGAADAGSAYPAASAETAAGAGHGRVVAVYPGSFDPATLGHVDIAMRAARLVDDLIVAVYATPSKNLLFTSEERVALWRDAIATSELANVRVEPYEGLTTTFARQVGAQAIVRGLRAVSDFEVEFQQALMYRKLAPEIETLMVVTSLRHLFVSSSLLKEVARLGGDVNDLVTPNVARALQEKFGH
ncbi:MAG TPA: pantetheine-phosphate adenylyltransferase [Ktedonobacterales bacterium]